MKGQDNPHPHLLNSIIKKTIIVPSSYQHKKTHKTRKAIRTTEVSQSSGPINLVADETVYKEWEDRMERAATTASSLDAEQDSGSGPRCQVTILGGAEAQTWFEAASKQSNDPPLSRVNTLGSGEDSMKLKELMELCTKLSDIMSKNRKRDVCIKTERVICLRLILFWATAKVKMVNGECQLQALVDKKKVILIETSIRSDLHLEDSCSIDCLPTATIFEELAKIGLYKVGVTKRVASSDDEGLGAQEDASKQERSKIEVIDIDVEVTLVDESQEMNDYNLMFDTDVLEEQEKDDAKKEVSTADLVTTAGEVVTTANVEVNTAKAPKTNIDELTLA
ncbi:hypothetical protein Tco_1159269 [Tanacetum coccineum]